MAALTPEKFKVIGYTEEDANRIDRPTISYWQDAWRRLRKNPIAMGSLVVLGILLVMVIIGPHIKGYDYVSMNIAEKNQDVSSKSGLEPTTWDVTSSQESGSARGHH